MDGWLDDLGALLVVKYFKRVAPLLVVVLIEQCGEGRQRLLTVGHHSHIGLYILVYLAAVDIQMDNLSLLGVGLQIARHTIAEAHTNGYEHVTLLFLQVDGIVAMHA